MATPRKVYVVGVGMTKFEKPGRREEFDYPDMAKEAGSKALKDAGISYTEVDQAVVGYCYGDSTCGQRALYQLGMTGIPIYNVNNACATGSSALFLAKQLIEGGSSECVLALGFEKMERGSLGTKYTDRITPMDKHVEALANTNGLASSPITAQMFAAAGVEHMKKYGTRPEHFAKIAEKNHRHSVNNPYSQFRDEYTLKEIQSSRMVHEPLTKLQCCPTSDGSGAAVLCSEDFVRKHNLQSQAVEIIAMAMRTDFPSTFGENSPMKLVGYDMTKAAAEEIYRKTGYRPDDIHVVELHDCFSSNEMITYEALGLCPPGKAGEMIDRGDNTYGGKYVINPSGGLISKGHPLGATGLAQCSELCWQLRGQADKRQVPGAKLALQHNLGLGGAVVISLYRLGFPEHAMAARRRHDISLNPTSTTTLKSAVIFEEIEKEIEQNGAAIVPKIKGSYVFKITGSDGTVQEWLVDLKSGNGSVKKGSGLKGDCNISMKDDDFMDMATGKLNGQKAFFAGKLKISGNTSMAMKLQSIMPKPSTSTGTKTSTTKSTGGPILKSALIFDEIEKEIAKNGATIVPKIKGSYAFKITGSDGTVQEWLVDLKSGNGSIKKGSGLKGDCNISMKDDDFMDMATGKLNGQKAFFAGKLKISGNTSMAMKLQSIMPKPPKAKL